jgi:hypothetical protein
MVAGGSILAGGAAGAAAGLTLVMLIKGKDVVVDPGDRFNLQLVQPLSLYSPAAYYPPRPLDGPYGSIREPIPLRPRERLTRPRSTTSLYPYQSPYNNDPYSVRTTWSRVPVYDVRAERDSTGLVRIFVTAETQTSGWKIYTNYEVQPQDTVDIRLMGIPPSTYGTRRPSHPTAAPICVEDRGGYIRRIIVHGSNGERFLTIGPGAGSAQLDPYSRPTRPSASPYSYTPPAYTPPPSYTPAPSYPQSSPPTPQPIRPRPGVGPSDGSLGNLEFPSSTAPPITSTAPSTSLSALATQVANQIEVLKFNYAAAIGLYVNPRDGSVESLGGRTPTANDRQLFDTINYMQSSARSLASPTLDSYNRQRSAQRLQGDAQTANGMWQRARSTGMISADLDRQWQNLQTGLRSLVSAASR